MQTTAEREALTTDPSETLVSCSLWDLCRYFLRLGTFGFGGPIALVGYMQKDLVEERRWISKDDYVEGLALAQLAPGPLAAQLAIFIGWVRGKLLGATVVGLAFVLPSFLMVLAISAVYLRYGGLPWMQGAFYGIGAAVIAIIARSVQKLLPLTLAKDRVLWAVFSISAIVTAWTESELVWVFVLSGVVTALIKAPPRATPALLVAAPWSDWTWITSGIHGQSAAGSLWKICWFFAEAGTFVFGSGLAIVPFLYGGTVDRFHWLTERQFLDAVAVAMITPGPVVITVAFIGYLVSGPAGAVVAAIGTFLPCYLFTVLLAPYFRRLSKSVRVKAFVDGVTAAATGAIAGAAFVLGKRAFVDVPTVVIGLVTLGVLVGIKKRKIPEPLVILVAGVIGLVIHGTRQP